MQKPKRDFIFIDESGEPGTETSYYILGLLHITDKTIDNINLHLGAFRYFGNIKKELKSTKLNHTQRDKLLNILKYSVNNQDVHDFTKATSVYANKKNYKGNYLGNNEEEKDATRFRHFMVRRLLEFHFSKNKPQTNEIELIFDRFHSGETKEQQMRNYLRKLSYLKILPNFLHITQADSRYLELLQVVDWVAGSVKEKFFTHPERDHEDLFNFIDIKEVFK